MHPWRTGTCVFMGVMALIPAKVLCARSQCSILSVSLCRVRVASSTAGFKGGRNPCSKTCETTTLRRGIQKASHTWLGSNPSHRCTSSWLHALELPDRGARPLTPNRFSFWITHSLMRWISRPHWIQVFGIICRDSSSWSNANMSVKASYVWFFFHHYHGHDHTRQCNK